MNALTDRANNASANRLDEGLRASLRLISEIISMQPRRLFYLGSPHFSRVVVASDAAYENGDGSGGFLVILHPNSQNESRLACVADLPPELYEIWGHQETYIAQLELYMVLAGLARWAEEFREKRGIWFIDNIAALMALVRGRSRSQSLDNLARAIHAAMFALKAWIYFEWVPSDSNWSDGISRDGARDGWYRRNRFKLRNCVCMPKLLQLPTTAMVRVFEML